LVDDISDIGPGADVAGGLCEESGDLDICMGDQLLKCTGGHVLMVVPCEDGCIATPGGLDDICSVPPQDGPCEGVASGTVCDGPNLLICDGESVASGTFCGYGCLAVSEVEAACVEAPDPQSYCSEKADGALCVGAALWTCEGGAVVSTLDCPEGCIAAPAGEDHACAKAPDDTVCTGVQDGVWCVGDVLLACFEDQAVSQVECLHGCIDSGLASGSYCAPGSPPSICAQEPNGGLCSGATLLLCEGGTVVSEEDCATGCEDGACAPAGFCLGKQNGAWCKGGDLVTCLDGVEVAFTDCEVGCTSMPAGVADVCETTEFCVDVPPMKSPSPPTDTCSYMDWKLSPDGFYLVSQFGTSNDPTTWGHTSSCGYLSMHYAAHGCIYDKQVGACIDGDPNIPWVQGHVDYDYATVVSTVAANMDGDVPAPEYFYVAGAQRFGCGATLRVTNPQNGRCVVAYAEDGGPGAKYESGPFGGRRILDASPALIQYLEIGAMGWKNSTLLRVEWGAAGDVPGHECTPCGAAGASEAEASGKSPHLLEHTVPSCGSGYPEGQCPGGDGLYCGGSQGLQSNGLYNCLGGVFSPVETCEFGCQENPPGQPDGCAAGEPTGGGEDGICPFGDGLYCGETLELDQDKLYNCQEGQSTVVEACEEGCNVAPPGSADACSAVAGATDGKLVMCNPFSPAKSVTCGFGCYNGHMGSDYAAGQGTPLYSPISGTVSMAANSVAWQTCTPNFGCYVKIQQGPYDVILGHMDPDLQVSSGQVVGAGTPVGYVSNTGYTMTVIGGEWVCGQGGGHHLHLEVRKNGNAFDPFNSSDVVWTGSCADVGGGTPGPTGFCVGKMDGAWCDGDALVTCVGGSVVASAVCPSGCKSNPVGVADACNEGAPAECPAGNGKYCGAALGKSADKLYQCENGDSWVLEDCANGCHIAPAGQSDYCEPDPEPEPECPAGNGKYCGATLGESADKLYQCEDGDSWVIEDCANGCHIAPAGQSDYCEPPPQAGCPSGNGLYCGATLGLDGSTLYSCSDGDTSFQAWCAAGCNIAPAGQSDSCKSGSCPSGNGAYCGQTGGLDSGKLYDCSNGAWTVKQSCGGSCVVAPPGSPDYCP
jgi:hypothetical protein